jgi:hypothetical protein
MEVPQPGMSHFEGIPLHLVQLVLGLSRCSTNRAMSSDTLLLKTHADEYRWAEPDAYSESAISLYSSLVPNPHQFRTWARDW